MKNIGQTAELTGLSQRMLRYFEDQGLLKPNRSAAGSRLFSDEDITEILRIRKLHDLGFTYPEIKGLLDANEQELASKGTRLLEKHHEAALDLQSKIQNLEMICFGEKQSLTPGPNGQRTLDGPHRTAHTLRGASAASARFGELCGLRETDFSYWKFSWLSKQPTLGAFSLYEIFEASALMAVFEGGEKIEIYERAWKEKTGASLVARDLGKFPAEDLDQFFSAHEIVIEQKLVAAEGTVGFHALLPYSAFFAALGRNSDYSDTTAPIELTYRSIDLSSLDDFKLLAKWSADSSIRHLSCPHRDEKDLAKRFTAEEIQQNYSKQGPFAPVEHLLILQGDLPIGNCSLIIDPPHKLTRDRKVAWFGITIGEEKLRAQGFGKQIALHLEKLARKHGAELAEVGVFEFNEPAQKLCRAMGYEQFGRVDRCTYWQGKQWADIRFRKKLR